MKELSIHKLESIGICKRFRECGAYIEICELLLGSKLEHQS
nr:MAG TPA: hypothetical protein [Caudoviricetes sp.]